MPREHRFYVVFGFVSQSKIGLLVEFELRKFVVRLGRLGKAACVLRAEKSKFVNKPLARCGDKYSPTQSVRRW